MHPPRRDGPGMLFGAIGLGASIAGAVAESKRAKAAEAAANAAEQTAEYEKQAAEARKQTADAQTEAANAQNRLYQNQQAQNNEHWVVCGYCGRKFNYSAEGGTFNRENKEYCCPNCVQAKNTSATWVCKSCGARTGGSVCEYCGSPRDTGTFASYKLQKNAAGGWTCPACGASAKGNFCTKCGGKKPAETADSSAEWLCTRCNKKVTGRFCKYCGGSR